MEGKIALEEHWAVNETLDIAGQPIAAGPFWDYLRQLLTEFREKRLAGMDATGIELAILGLNSPALQAILDPAEAVDVARRANDTAGPQRKSLDMETGEAVGETMEVLKANVR